MRFKHHVFVCVNRRPDGGKGSCAGRGSLEVLARLRAELLARPALFAACPLVETGCLGPCLDGPTLVVYPEGIWYAGVTPDDAAEIVREHLEGGRPVDRLVYQWPEP